MKWILVRSIQPHGLSELEVNVEVLAFRGLQHLALTGLPDAWLRDSKDKIKALLFKLGDWSPLMRIVVHLTPADIPKVGAHLEVPLLAASLLALEADELNDEALTRIKSHILVGAVDLQGTLLHTPLTRNFDFLQDPKILGPSQFDTIMDLLEYLKTGDRRKFKKTLVTREALSDSTALSLIADSAKQREQFWLSVAAVAQVPVLLLGAPGVGKSFLARWAYQLVQQPDDSQKARLRKLWSLAELPIPPFPPMVHPHARARLSDFIGMNRKGLVRPGHFSLAHKGLLVLDEFPELARDCREVLRNILDTKSLQRHSSQGSMDWPMDFWLIATANPCPCGYANGKDLSRCECRESERQHYQSRMSGPILDRMGVVLHVGKKTKPTIEKHFGETLLKIFDAKKSRTECLHKLIENQKRLLPKAQMLIRQQRSNEAYTSRSERRWHQDEKILSTLLAFDEHQQDLWLSCIQHEDHRDQVLSR